MQKIIDEIKPLIKAKIQQEFTVKVKGDNSLVTEIDLYISDLVKQKVLPYYADEGFIYYSEEDFSEFKFPLVILDPIDGTNELVAGIPECAVSLAIMYSPDLADERNLAWIFNPFDDFEIKSWNLDEIHKEQTGICYVSRTEWQKGLFVEDSFPQMKTLPMGSIAYKLGLLSHGDCKQVYSKRPKNIWDIAAGTLLCYRQGGLFFEQGKEVISLTKTIYQSDLLWKI
jgi:myo-inositol-1(or 4)-monophosphatase